MNTKSKIYIAGHRGMVGSAIMRQLKKEGYTNIVVRTRKELNLTRQDDTERFFEQEQPEYVFLAAAKVGGIIANSTYKADFIYQNIMIATNIVDASYKYGVKKLLNLGSTCIYPKLAPQPLKEESLLTGPLEPTNDAYAIAKISAIKLCRHYNEQYGTNFLSCMPTNLYGPNDSFNLETSHFLPAFIRKFHMAKLLKEQNFEAIKKDFQIYGHLIPQPKKGYTKENIKTALSQWGITKDTVTLWGTGSPYRELLYSEDLAQACMFLMQNFNAKDIGEFINIGTGVDYQIKEIARMVKDVVQFDGAINWDTDKPDGTLKKLADVSRINKLGWKAKIGLRKGINIAYNYYIERCKE